MAAAPGELRELKDTSTIEKGGGTLDSRGEPAPIIQVHENLRISLSLVCVPKCMGFEN